LWGKDKYKLVPVWIPVFFNINLIVTKKLKTFELDLTVYDGKYLRDKNKWQNKFAKIKSNKNKNKILRNRYKIFKYK
jgi:hypothetical protein